MIKFAFIGLGVVLCFGSLAAFGEPMHGIQYQVVGPVLFANESGYSEFFSITDATQADCRQEYCLGLLQKVAEKNFGNKVLPPLTGSSTEVSSTVPEGLIFLRGNLSRMELSQTKLALQNNNYVLSSTGGVELLDLSTGEVFFSSIFTMQSIRQVLGDVDAEDEQKFTELFQLNIDDLFDKIIGELNSKYQPGRIEAIACGEYDGKIILNMGRYEGVAERQRFRTSDGEVSISSVQDHLSQAEIMKGNPPKTGTKLVRIGANQIAAKGTLTLLVTDAVIMRPGLISEEFQVTEEILTQWVHDYLASDSTLAMLPPVGSTFLQQTELARKGTIADTTIRGNRALPDIFIRLRVPLAVTCETKGEDGATYTEFLVRLELEFYDRKTGLVLYRAAHEEKGLERIEKDYREIDHRNYFTKITKNAVYELTKTAKENFHIEVERGRITKVEKDTASFETEGLNVGVGSLFHVFRPHSEVNDPGTGKPLGFLEEMIGIAKVMQIKGKKGTVQIVVQQKQIQRGDNLRSTGSTLSPGACKKAIIVQAQPVKIINASGITFEIINSELGTDLLEHKLVDARYWSVLQNDKSLILLARDQRALEGGEFEISEWNKERLLLEPEQFVEAAITLLPVEEMDEKSKILRLQVDLSLSDVHGNTLSDQSVKMKRVLSCMTDKGSVAVGAEEKDLSRHYAEMAEATFEEALRRCLVDFEK